MKSRSFAFLRAMGASAAALVLAPVLAGLLLAPADEAQGATACKVQGIMATHTVPPYPPDSEKAGEQGTVLLKVIIARNGHVTRADVTHGSGHVRLDEAASTYVWHHYLWRPLPCASAQTNVKVAFKLADGPEAKPPAGKQPPIVHRAGQPPARH